MWVNDVAPVYTWLGTYLVSDDVWGLVDRQYVGWGFHYVADTSRDDGWWLGMLAAVAFVWLVWVAFGGFGAYICVVFDWAASSSRSKRAVLSTEVVGGGGGGSG